MSAPAWNPRMAEIRNAATATNHVVLLREIEALDTLYYVGKRRPISELTPEQQAKVREAYRDCHWSSDYGIEAQGVFTSKELAEAVCKERGPNWFYHALPINSCLPDETVFFRAHVFPGSDERAMYENLEAATRAVRVSELRALQEEIDRLQKQLDELRGT
jgi:hypothetical protein